MKSKIGLGSLVLLALLWIFNPGIDKHKSQIAESYGSGLVGSLARLAVGIGGLKYHNYLFFSTTTGAGGKTLSLGLLGKVFVLQD